MTNRFNGKKSILNRKVFDRAKYKIRSLFFCRISRIGLSFTLPLITILMSYKLAHQAIFKQMTDQAKNQIQSSCAYQW